MEPLYLMRTFIRTPNVDTYKRIFNKKVRMFEGDDKSSYSFIEYAKIYESGQYPPEINSKQKNFFDTIFDDVITTEDYLYFYFKTDGMDLDAYVTISTLNYVILGLEKEEDVLYMTYATPYGEFFPEIILYNLGGEGIKTFQPECFERFEVYDDVKKVCTLLYDADLTKEELRILEMHEKSMAHDTDPTRRLMMQEFQAAAEELFEGKPSSYEREYQYVLKRFKEYPILKLLKILVGPRRQIPYFMEEYEKGVNADYNILAEVYCDGVFGDGGLSVTGVNGIYKGDINQFQEYVDDDLKYWEELEQEE